ncbi:hypothetical protein [Thermococcus gammatolerans]|uniref:Uncharacterized protein n=1 Tax=Thermococcus gammatolerans (strain DSM 15229 / JCM 11827 / EJ3) TaxID=593117 RepID=C5A6F2_THEGJ|nr:hypothetical protein [Thermococcus gammatolerans]ACS33814.1 Conserved hypothetical protein [Thermococcus gammatolerans EJ3]
MRYSRIAVKLFEREGEDVFYDPAYHGRTLKVFGMEAFPDKALGYLAGEYHKKGYSRIIFDTKGSFDGVGFDTVLKIRDTQPSGLDPVKMAEKGYFDFYTAATIVQTIYGLDRALTETLYSDILAGKVESVPEALKAGQKYSEVIAESYTAIDQLLYSGEVPELGQNILVDFGDAHSITLVGNAFLILAAAVEKRKKVMVGLNDAAVLTYTTAGGAGLPLLTKPALKRATVIASEYAPDSLLNISGPVLLLYHDPDVQSMIYEANGVPPGPMRRHVLKGQGAFIYRTPETINVELGELHI